MLAHRAERVIEALGLVVQPWYMAVSPLSARPHEAIGYGRLHGDGELVAAVAPADLHFLCA